MAHISSEGSKWTPVEAAPSTDELEAANAPPRSIDPTAETVVGTTAEPQAQPDIATPTDSQQHDPSRPDQVGKGPAADFDPRELLAAIWRSPDRVHQIGIRSSSGGGFQHLTVPSASEAVERASSASKAGQEAYFACAEFSTPDSRKASNAAGAYALWLDVDVGEQKAAEGKGYENLDAANLALAAFCQQAGLPMPTHIVASGGGLHAYWVLDAFVDRVAWLECARKFKALTHEFKFQADDSRTADIASVLRIPGTLNHKYDPPREITLLQAASSFISMQEMCAAIDCAHAKISTPEPAQPKQLSGSGTPMPVGPGERAFHGPVDGQKLASALAVLDPDCSDSEWKLGVIAPLARQARDYPEQAQALQELARAFSSGALRGKPSKAWTTPGKSNKQTGEQAFDGQWERFFNEPPSDEKRTGLGTVFHNAEQAGWVNPAKLFGGVPSPEVAPDESVQTAIHAPTGVTSTPEAKVTATPKAVPNAIHQAEPSTLLSALQARFALLNMSGKVCVLDLQCLAATASDGTAKKLVLSNRSDGKLLMQRAAKVLHPDAAAGPQIQAFFESPDTTCFDGIEFNPSGTTANHLNLWVGPTVQPTPGQWPLIREFLLNVICSGIQSQYDYLTGLIAHALQRPWEKPGILVILIGGQGIGKGTLGRILRKIWSATYLQVNRVAAITGEFNSALERAYIVVMDEALFAGDHRASDALKSLVTEEVIHINEKHQPARQIASYHRFFIFSNADHVKTTDRDDRRDFTLRVSESRKDDHAYWIALDQEIQGRGVAAMVHDLLAMDLSGFNVRSKPSTPELVEQKLHSLAPIPRWWHDALYRAELAGESCWPEFITTENIIVGVLDVAGNRLHRKPSAVEVIQAVLKMCPSARKGQKQVLGTRQRGLFIPDLELARSEFERYIGGAVQWDADADQQDNAQDHDGTDGGDVY